jgi:hypothetical protein
MLWTLVFAYNLMMGAPPAPLVSLECQPDRPTIVAGEPLVLAVTVRNLSKGELLIPTDSDSLERMTEGPMGLRLAMAPTRHEGETISGYVRPNPGESRTFLVLAAETAQLRVPGEYRMSVRYPEFGVFGEVRFNVLAYDRGALQKRAEEFYTDVIDRRSTGRSILSKRALAAIEPEIAQPLLCAILKRDPEELDRAVSYALEQSISPGVADCLIEILPRGSDIARRSAEQVLRRMAQRTQDPGLRAKIIEALAKE